MGITVKKLLKKKQKEKKKEKEEGTDLRAEKALCIQGTGKARGSREESVKRTEDRKVPLGRWFWSRLHRNKMKFFLKPNKQTNQLPQPSDQQRNQNCQLSSASCNKPKLKRIVKF